MSLYRIYVYISEGKCLHVHATVCFCYSYVMTQGNKHGKLLGNCAVYIKLVSLINPIKIAST